MTKSKGESLGEFALVEPGTLEGMAGGGARVGERVRRVLLLWLVTWGPLVLLSLASGYLWSGKILLPFLHDLEVQARFLVVLPLLEFAKLTVARSLAAQAKQFLEMGLVSAEELPRFQAAKAWAVRLRFSKLVVVLLVVLSLAISLGTRMGLRFSAGDPSWERINGALTPAGMWYTLVSLPILYFMLLRWIWIFALWGGFLFRVSRLKLALTATHPDRAGGVGFVGWGLASFSMVLMAVSTVFSAAFVDQIVHRGESIDSLKYHVMVYAAIALAVLHLPLFSFSGQLSRCRFQGLLEFGKLIWEHDRDFDEKWIKRRDKTSKESLLGNADIQTLASAATAYEHVDRMWLIPFDVKAFVTLFLAILVPMIPLVGTAIPLNEIFMKLIELVL